MLMQRTQQKEGPKIWIDTQKRNIRMANKHIRKWSKSLTVKETENKSKNEIPLHIYWRANNKATDITRCW